MKKIFLTLSVIVIISAFSSTAFAYEETARDAMIAYSGTKTFAALLPEERQACMFWVAEGGTMSETCRSAVTRLISEEPDAVTPRQRRELLAAAAGGKSASKPPVKPATTEKPKVIVKDNTGAIIAAGVLGIVAGMVIHNNLPSRHVHHRPGPPPPPPHHHRPGPPPHCHPRPPR